MVYFTIVKNYTILSQPKILDALNNKFTIDTQIFRKFVNVLYDVFLFLLPFLQLEIVPLYVVFS